MSWGGEVARIAVGGAVAASIALAVLKWTSPGGGDQTGLAIGDRTNGTAPLAPRSPLAQIAQDPNPAAALARPESPAAARVVRMPRVTEPLTDQEEAARAQAHLRDSLVSHQQESVDPEWASGKEKQISDAIGQVGQLPGVIGTSVGCRSVSCIATLRWESAIQMRQSFFSLTGALRKVPCAFEAALPDGNLEEGNSTDLPIYIDCTEERFGEGG